MFFGCLFLVIYAMELLLYLIIFLILVCFVLSIMLNDVLEIIIKNNIEFEKKMNKLSWV